MNFLYPWHSGDWPSSLARYWLCGSTDDHLAGALRLSAVRQEPAMFPLSAAHSGECSCYSKHVHQDRVISILWWRKPPEQLLRERRFPFTVLHSPLLIAETFLNKNWIYSRM